MKAWRPLWPWHRRMSSKRPVGRGGREKGSRENSVKMHIVGFNSRRSNLSTRLHIHSFFYVSELPGNEMLRCELRRFSSTGHFDVVPSLRPSLSPLYLELCFIFLSSVSLTAGC